MKSVLHQAAMLLIGLLLFVGLPSIGWGITDLDGFLSHPARLGFVVVTVVMQVLTVILIPDVGRHAGVGEQLVRRQKLALLFLQILSVALMFIAPYSDCHDWMSYASIEWLRYLGLVVYAIGFVIMTWAQVQLGRQFSVQVTLQRDHLLITDGCYKCLRHPRYLGIVLFSIGVALIFRSWASLVLVGLISAVLVWRIHDEEVLLHREFGAAWEAYRGRSWKMLPGIY